MAILRSPQLQSDLGAIEWNQLRQEPTVRRQPLIDADVGQLREHIETAPYCRGPNGQRLQFSQDECWRALIQVATEHNYHPVAEYLESLVWDGTERICHVAEDVLGIEPTGLTQAILRRWFISAVARPLRAGCKVDTVLILQGDQGAKKSSFFEVLAGRDWFSDSAIDLAKNDAPMVMRRVWILEWAELESMQRARDANAVKQFITSRVDIYRPPYGRAVIDVPRTCVIVGTTNDKEILADPTGNRRYWILEDCDRVDLSKLAAWRDQLWAEAVVLYRTPEPWHLTEAEDRELGIAQERFEKIDAWESKVLPWLANPRGFLDGTWQAMSVTTANVLEYAVGKQPGQWSPRDASRVATLMRGFGWEQERRRGAGRVRVWKPRPDPTGTTSVPLTLKLNGDT